VSDDYQRLSELVIAGDIEAARALTEALLGRALSGRQILDGGLLPGMDAVGARMKAGECFIPEVLLSARTMQACLDLVKPHLAAGESASTGMVILGTVEGDVHGHRQEPGRHDARGRRL
jgi:5-methyltetrahydrofolate--homocysteine methyltransferase